MANEFVYVTGTFDWIHSSQLDKFEKWSVQVHPDKDGFEKLLHLQSKGVKNTLKKDDKGYYCNFSRPKEIKKDGKVIRTLEPPKVIDNTGATITDKIGNGASGTLKLEVYEHGTPNGGKAHAARWDSLMLDKYEKFEPKPKDQF